MGVTGLGRTGLWVGALDTVRGFYDRVLGVPITDADDEHGSVFLSVRPELEQHERILQHGRTGLRGTKLTHQMSSGCRYAFRLFDDEADRWATARSTWPGRWPTGSAGSTAPDRVPWRTACTRCWPTASATDPASCWARPPT